MLEKWATSNGLQVEGDAGFVALLQDPKINKLYIDEIVAVSRTAGFFGFEIPQKVHLTSTAFTAENDILTPTFKLKRNEARRFFFNEIKAMYGGDKLQGEE